RFGAAIRKHPELSGMTQTLFDRLVPQLANEATYLRHDRELDSLLDDFGFDRELHEQIRADLKRGRIGLAQNRLPSNTTLEDVRESDVVDAGEGTVDAACYQRGLEALRSGAVAVVSLAAGAGSRWTQGAGVVKALSPFAKLGGRHRTFIEVHLEKSR